MTWDQWVILIFGPAALLFAFSERWRMWGPVSGSIGQVAWWITLIEHAQWGAVVASVFYTAAWSIGLWNFRKEYKCSLQKWIARVTESWRSVASTTKSYLNLPPKRWLFFSPSRIVPPASSSGCGKYTWPEIGATVRRFLNGC